MGLSTNQLRFFLFAGYLRLDEDFFVVGLFVEKHGDIRYMIYLRKNGDLMVILGIYLRLDEDWHCHPRFRSLQQQRSWPGRAPAKIFPGESHQRRIR